MPGDCQGEGGARPLLLIGFESYLPCRMKGCWDKPKPRSVYCWVHAQRALDALRAPYTEESPRTSY